jgi:hypothetical protein
VALPDVPLTTTPVRLNPRRLAFGIALACAACGLAYVVYALVQRPYGAVEAELVFQASRIQRGFPLYIDPAVGAWEYGPPPSRYYVLYTPLWPWLLAHISPHTLEGIRTVGRALNGLLLLLTLFMLVRASKPENRLAVATGAALALGFEMIVREATLADADMPAVFLSTLAMTRMNARGGLDSVSAGLFAATPLVKPSMLGAGLGAVVAHVYVHRRSGARRLLVPLASGVLVAGALVLMFHRWSGGAWLSHIVRATGQPLSLDRWVREFGARVMFLGAPHAAVCALAARRGSSPFAVIPLATSTAWATFSMAKHGSGAHYWLEPTTAALVALGAMPAARAATSAALGWVALGLTTVAGAEGVVAFARAPADYASSRAHVERVLASCPREPGEVLVAGSAGLELVANGRVIVPAWQNAYLIRTGQFPLQAWREDLALPQVRCFVHARDFLDPPPERIEGMTEVSPYRKELRDVIEENFVLQDEFDGLLVFRRR